MIDLGFVEEKHEILNKKDFNYINDVVNTQLKVFKPVLKTGVFYKLFGIKLPLFYKLQTELNYRIDQTNFNLVFYKDEYHDYVMEIRNEINKGIFKVTTHRFNDTNIENILDPLLKDGELIVIYRDNKIDQLWQWTI